MCSNLQNYADIITAIILKRNAREVTFLELELHGLGDVSPDVFDGLVAVDVYNARGVVGQRGVVLYDGGGLRMEGVESFLEDFSSVI